jgi:mRNA-degrading endonuclease HigB of HigAB toxin-antitoxin module
MNIRGFFFRSTKTPLLSIEFELSHNAIMILIGQDILARAGRKNRSSRRSLLSWAATVDASIWRNLKGLVVTVFNVKGKESRLLTAIDYDA